MKDLANEENQIKIREFIFGSSEYRNQKVTTLDRMIHENRYRQSDIIDKVKGLSVTLNDLKAEEMLLNDIRIIQEMKGE